MHDDRYKFWWPKDPPTRAIIPTIGTQDYYTLNYCPNVLKWVTTRYNVKKVYTPTGILITETILEDPPELTGRRSECSGNDKNGNTYVYYDDDYNGGIAKYSLFGELKWAVHLEFDIGCMRDKHNTIQISDDGDVFVQTPDLVAIDGNTGKIMWTIDKEEAPNSGLPAVVGNHIFWEVNGKLWLIDTKTGEIIKRTGMAFINDPTFIRKGSENDVCLYWGHWYSGHRLRRYTYDGELGFARTVRYIRTPRIAMSKVDSRVAFVFVDADSESFNESQETPQYITCYDKNGNTIYSYLLTPKYKYGRVINFDSGNRLLIRAYNDITKKWCNILFSPSGEIEYEIEQMIPYAFIRNFDWWNSEKPSPFTLVKDYGRESLYNNYSFSEKRHKKMRGG